MISIVLHRPRPQLSPFRPSFLLPSLIPNFDFHDILPGFGWGGILPGFGWGSFLPGFIKPPFLRPPKPGVFPGSGEEDDNEEGGSVFEPTVVFNETLKKEECLKTIKEEKRSGYKILKIDVVSHLIDKNETDLTYLQFDLQWEDSKENERICTAFIGFASNMTRQCAIVECEWYDEETTTIKPTVKPSGRYLVISKMSKQIVEQISKFVKF